MEIGASVLYASARLRYPLSDRLHVSAHLGVDRADFDVAGRESVLDEARKELAAESLREKVPVLGTSVAAAPEGAFDYAWSFSVLFHMTDEILLQTMRDIAVRLKPDGRFYANAACGSREPASWQGFPVIWRELRVYAEAAAASGFEVSDLGTLRALGHVSGMATHDDQHILCFRPLNQPATRR